MPTNPASTNLASLVTDTAFDELMQSMAVASLQEDQDLDGRSRSPVEGPDPYARDDALVPVSSSALSTIRSLI